MNVVVRLWCQVFWIVYLEICSKLYYCSKMFTFCPEKMLIYPCPLPRKLQFFLLEEYTCFTLMWILVMWLAFCQWNVSIYHLCHIQAESCGLTFFFAQRIICPRKILFISPITRRKRASVDPQLQLMFVVTHWDSGVVDTSSEKVLFVDLESHFFRVWLLFM